MMRIEQLRNVSPVKHEEFLKWFVSTLPTRLDVFFEMYRKTGGKGELDFEPESLISLARWLAEKVEFRRFSNSEMEQFRSSMPSWMHDSLDQPILTDEWEEHCWSVGTYYGSIFTHANPAFSWRISKMMVSKNKDINYGQPVITSPSGYELAPLSVVRVVMLGIRHTPDPLVKIISGYNHWATAFGIKRIQ